MPYSLRKGITSALLAPGKVEHLGGRSRSCALRR